VCVCQTFPKENRIIKLALFIRVCSFAIIQHITNLNYKFPLTPLNMLPWLHELPDCAYILIAWLCDNIIDSIILMFFGLIFVVVLYVRKKVGFYKNLCLND